MTCLLMRVRMAAKNDPQFQIPISLYKEYFEDTDGVISCRNEQRHRCVLAYFRSGKSAGKLHTVKLETPEIKQFLEPVISFSKYNGEIIYTAYDGTADDGRPLYTSLLDGIANRTTKCSINRIESATLWTYCGLPQNPMSVERKLPARCKPVKRVVLFGEEFTKDPELALKKKQRKKELELLNHHQIEDTEGYVYVISHPFFTGLEGWVSVGKTWNYDSRISTYDRGDPHCRYKLEYQKKFGNRNKAEVAIHSLLERLVKKQGEWFETTIEHAISVVKKFEEEPTNATS